MKKIALSSFITCLFLFLLFFSANPVSASTIAETGTCGKNATYTTDSDGTVIISGTGKIDDFNTRKIIAKKIIIQEGITEICDEALAYHLKVTEIQLPSSVKKVGRWAFRTNYSLNKIVFSEGLEEIGEEAFFEDTALKEIELPDSVTKVGCRLFYECYYLEKVKLSRNINEISNELFSGCKALRSVIWPDKCKKVGVDILYETNYITSFTVPDSVEYLDRYIFEGAEGVKTLIVGTGVKKVHKNYASDSVSLHKIVNNSSITLPLPLEKGRKRWFVNGKQVSKLAPGKTAIMRGKKYKIKYYMDGGKAVSKLPKKHSYTTDTPLPKVKRKGYTFLGWRVGGTNDWDNTTNLISKRIFGEIGAKPILKKCKISSKNCKISVNVKDSTYGTKKYDRNYDMFYFRYADNKKMKNATMVLFTAPYGKGLTKKLKKGTYYVELAQGFDAYQEEYEDYYTPIGGWVGKRKVVVK